ncbi:alpha/beta fold hydrolase [Glycomyces sp. NPDC021274]|uniref:alpha/beta fold hydrolase n=1 Tax=Glycomyces sp. NPDC021274 TaxID=3155120 RepID=UPI0033F2D390
MPTHHLSRTLTWQGRTIAWDRFGSGPALVLLHGTPWSSYLWRPFADAFAERFTVHLWDMPGYGQSSKDSSHAVDLGFQSEVFAHLLQEWGLERPHVIAHDYGGTVALRARLLHGARYASLCLIDVVALRPWGSPFYRLVREHADVLTQLPPAVHRGAVEAYIRSASHRGLSKADLEALVEPWTGEAGLPAFYRQIEAADERFTDEVEDRYGDIDEPTRIVWGADDAWIPVDHAHRLQAAMPGASLALIEDAGHLVQLDAPVRLAAELTRWTESVRSTP